MQTTIIRDAIIDHLKESEKPREKIVKCVWCFVCLHNTNLQMKP
jgi:hypothetical protein